MTKYKIVGILNFVVGIPFLLAALILGFFVFPQMQTVYNEMQIDVTRNTVISLVSLVILVIFSGGNILFGFLGFAKRQKNDTLFHFGLIALLLTFTLGGIVFGVLTTSIILPIYTLSSQIK